MSVVVNWANPYEDRCGQWYKGNLHAHTSPASACGKVPLARALDLYVQSGYDFLAVSDHMKLSRPQDSRLTLIPGVEWNSPLGEHVGVYSLNTDILDSAVGIADHVQLLAFLGGKDALAVLNHPNWELQSHYRREKLQERQGYDGIEIYNHVIERCQGYAISTDKWDFLLAQDRRVLGFANDDSHAECDIGNAWISVRAHERTPAAILEAVRRGNFYCSCGVELTDIRREGDAITVESRGGQEIQAIGEGGIMMQRVRQESLTFDIKAARRYVRFAVYGTGSSMAWTQPFFKE